MGSGHLETCECQICQQRQQRKVQKGLALHCWGVLSLTCPVQRTSVQFFKCLDLDFSFSFSFHIASLSSSSSVSQRLPLMLYQWSSAHWPYHFGFLTHFYLRYINFHMKMELPQILQRLSLMCMTRLQEFFLAVLALRVWCLEETFSMWMSSRLSLHLPLSAHSRNFFTGDSHSITLASVVVPLGKH